MSKIDKEYVRALEHFIYDDAEYEIHQGADHPACPWCGGEMRLEWSKTGAEVWCLIPACMTCGYSCETNLPVPEGKEVFDELPEHKRQDIMAEAWRAHDNARWVKLASTFILKFGEILRDLEQHLEQTENQDVTPANNTD